MNWFKTLTAELRALVATGIAVTLVLITGGIGYYYATAENREDCGSLTKELETLNTEFANSKETAETFIAGLEKTKHATGFTTYSAGKHGVEEVQAVISKYVAEIPTCKTTQDFSQLKALIESNNVGVKELNDATARLEKSLQNYQVRTLKQAIDKKLEQLRNIKITITGSLERGKHMEAFASSELGSKLVAQAQSLVTQIDGKIAEYAKPTEDINKLEERLTKLEADSALISSANDTSEQIEKTLASYVKPLQTTDPEKEKQKEKEDKEKAEKEKKDKTTPATETDIIWYGEDCGGDTFEYRKSYGWDVASAVEHAKTNCKSSHAP